MGALIKIGNALSRLGTVLRGGEMSFGTWSGVSGRSYSRSGARNNPGERVEAAHQNSRLWSAINRISLDMASSELYVATRSGSKIQRRYDGPLNEWMANPWRGMGGGSMFSLLYLTQFSLETCREAFWLIIGASPEQGIPPQEVWPIPAHWVFSLPRDNFPFYGLTPGGAKTEIPTWVPAAEMCHFRMPNAIDPFGRGCSAPWAIDDEVVFGDESNKYLNSFFRNNARPDLVFFIENATHQQAQELRANWERRHRGSLNSHRIEVLPATGRIEQMATSFADMTLVDLKRLNRDEIWQHFGLSPEIMGAVENSNRASIEAASYHHSLYNRMPRLTFFVQEFNRLMAPMFTPRGRRHLLMFENPVRETEEFKLEKTIQGWANGLVARGEARQALGHDEFGDGRDDDIGQPLNTALIGPDNVPRGLPKPTDSGAKPASKPAKKAKKSAGADEMTTRIHESGELRAEPTGKRGARVMSAVVSTTQIDRHGTIILPQSMREDLPAYVANPVMLWAHDGREMPMGRAIPGSIRIRDDQDVSMDFEEAPDDEEVQRIWDLYEKGFLRGFSVGGYVRSAVYEWDKDGRKTLPKYAQEALLNGDCWGVFTRFALSEVSGCPVPSNPGALKRAIDSGAVSANFRSLLSQAQQIAELERRLCVIQEHQNVLLERLAEFGQQLQRITPEQILRVASAQARQSEDFARSLRRDLRQILTQKPS